MSAETQHPVEFHQAKTACEKSVAQIVHRAPWLNERDSPNSLQVRLEKIVNENASDRSKLAKLRSLAAELSEVFAPSTPCKVGCTHCCHIAVAISDLEAEMISKATGVAMNKVTRSAQEAANVRNQMRDDFFGTPCPFLKDNQCSIYEHRPISCRMHVTLADSAFFCDTAIAPEDSFVPEINLPTFLMAQTVVLHRHSFGDIREFFGSNLSR